MLPWLRVGLSTWRSLGHIRVDRTVFLLIIPHRRSMTNAVSRICPAHECRLCNMSHSCSTFLPENRDLTCTLLASSVTGQDVGIGENKYRQGGQILDYRGCFRRKVISGCGPSAGTTSRRWQNGGESRGAGSVADGP